MGRGRAGCDFIPGGGAEAQSRAATVDAWLFGRPSPLEVRCETRREFGECAGWGRPRREAGGARSQEVR